MDIQKNGQTVVETEGDRMEYAQIIRNRRAVRDFEDRPVDLEIIHEIVRESCLAPCSMNRQEWEFVIVNDREMMKRISNESKRNIAREIETSSGPYDPKFLEDLKNENFNVFYNAPCLVIILGPEANHRIEIDCSLAACYLMFAATERGLGTCWIGLGSVIRDAALLEELGIGDDLKVVAPIILGYPKVIPEIPERKPPKILKVFS